MGEEWGYILKDRVLQLMDERELDMGKMVNELETLFTKDKQKMVDDKTVSNWLENKKYNGAVRVQHAEYVAQILGVELREIWQPQKEIVLRSHEDVTNGIMSRNLQKLSSRENLIALYKSIGHFRYYFGSIDLFPILRTGWGRLWRNQESSKYAYVVMEVSPSGDGNFSESNISEKEPLIFYWAPYNMSNIIQFLNGIIYIKDHKLCCWQPWTGWDDEIEFTKDGKILIAFWLDLLPADFVLYHHNRKFQAEIRVCEPGTKNHGLPYGIFDELASLYQYRLLKIQPHLEKIKDRKFLIFPKQIQHKHDRN